MRTFGRVCSRIAAFIWRFLPWRVNEYLGRFLAFLWIDLFGIRRSVIDSNLELAFPGMNQEKKTSIARASMVSMCRSFFDVIKIPSLSAEWVHKNVIFEGLEEFEKIKPNSQGVLFLTLHLGSGDLGAAVISEVILPTTLITKRFKNQFLDSFWFGLRGRSKTEFIDAHGKKNAFEILGALKKNRGVIFVLDQFMGKPYGVETDFFGVKTGTAYGLALFAKKTRLPVVPIYTFWDDTQKLHICFGPTVDLNAEFSEAVIDSNAAVTNRFNQELERIITAHPKHWMWVHRRWKTFE